jgi:DNA invertase Pin-like site-specific DNA recombinase
MNAKRHISCDSIRGRRHVTFVTRCDRCDACDTSVQVKAGLERARTQGTRSGKPIGRPRVMLSRDEVAELRRNGLSWRQVAARMGAGVGTVRRAAKRPSNALQACQNP